MVSKIDKLIEKVLAGRTVTYDEAERLLFHLGFELRIASSHHIFTKYDYVRNISIKRRKELLDYQMVKLRQIVRDHNYE